MGSYNFRRVGQSSGTDLSAMFISREETENKRAFFFISASWNIMFKVIGTYSAFEIPPYSILSDLILSNFFFLNVLNLIRNILFGYKY